jgi:hypothetical protein
MSYSRWGEDSYWYTFYGCDNRFHVGMHGSFSAEEIRNNLDAVLAHLAEEADATDEQIEELRGYALMFLKDYDSKKYRMETFSP